jgi:translation initiation factor 3 subunit A
LVRAIRIEELPLIKKNYEERVQRDREQYERDIVEKAKDAKLKWESDVKEKQQLEDFNVFQYISQFQDQVLAGRKIKHETSCRLAEERAEIDAERGKIERAKKRKSEEARIKAEEEERLRREEEEARVEAERQVREEAKREKELKEEAARERELQRMDEERRKKEQEKGPSKYVPPSKRGGGDAGGASGSGDRTGGGVAGSRFGGAGSGGSSYPGGGRYDSNRSREQSTSSGAPPTEGNSRWRN